MEILLLSVGHLPALVSVLREGPLSHGIRLLGSQLKVEHELKKAGISFTTAPRELPLLQKPTFVVAESASLLEFDRSLFLTENALVVVDEKDFPLLVQRQVSAAQRLHLRSHLHHLFHQIDSQRAAEAAVHATRVLVVGSGGREHAIAHKLLERTEIEKVFVAPGNGGTAIESQRCENVPIAVSDITALVNFAVAENIHLVIVGPEQPLVDGIVDAFQATNVNIPCFGPTQQASILEASKAWSKDFMQRHQLPTATFGRFRDFPAAKNFIETTMVPVGSTKRVVVKASGIAAGKGVLLPTSKEEALANARQILEDGLFGDAGQEIVIEEYLEGEEVSILAFADGVTAYAMPPAQDHKRVFEDDKGPNTGGMGAYAPSPVISPLQFEECSNILKKTVAAMAMDGRPYHGVLYGGFILTPDHGPMLLEFNCRFGDPETQVLLPLLESDLCEIALACVEGRLGSLVAYNGVRFKKNSSACTVVIAAPGYPDVYPKGLVVEGAVGDDNISNVSKVYHAGTTTSADGQVLTSGGRVFAVTGVAPTLEQAVTTAYQRVADVHFPGMHYRRDIARRGLRRRPLRIGVLGSTRGSSLQPVIEAIQSPDGALFSKATIECVISNVPESVDNILGRARKHHIPAIHVPMTTMEEDTATHTLIEKKKTRKEYDAELVGIFQKAGVDLILCIGYMRILSPTFVQAFPLRCLNVHPSLLPDFAGGMDLDVHRAVLAAHKEESGCTVHFVTEEVDGGPIAVQIRVPVLPSDTPETLKARVQPQEGIAFIEAIQRFADGHIGPASQTTKETITYRQAGVDIDAGEALVDRIKPFCRSTKRSGCDIFTANEEMLGGFGGLFDLSKAGYPAEDTILVSGTDGVGTKLKIAQSIGKHDTIGIDLVAMCVNDILVCGAEPLFFLDYYATGALQVEEAAAVVSGIAEGCRQAGCALIGGETAEMAGMYRRGEYDLAGFAVGAVRRPRILPRSREIQAGDVLLGLSSSGVHSNGYSLVRKCVEKSGLPWTDAAPFAPTQTLGEALLTPTRIYIKALLSIVRRGLVKAMAHITGGGLLDNLPRVLPDGLCAVVDIPQSGWTLPPVFAWLQEIANLPQNELLRTFNNGIGMVLVVSSELAAEVISILTTVCNEPLVYRLGQLHSVDDATLGHLGITTDGGQVKVVGELR